MAVSEATSNTASATGARPGKVLVVDDEPLLLHAYKKLLTSSGWSVETATNGAEACARVEREDFDVVVSDIRMPGMTGVEFLRAVREHDLDVPVVLLTGDPDVDTAAAAVEYGAFRYLSKPVENATLLEAMHTAARLHRMAKLKREALEIAGWEGRSLGDRAALEARFACALDRLWIAFQPIVSWKRRTVFGYEALVRSSEPTLQHPADLFDVASRLGQLHALGRAIRARVAAAARSLPAECRLLVNAHPEDLNDDDLFLPSAPLNAIADRVVLEITERSPLEHVEGVHARIASLRKLGFQIAVDDLGAGYAGLSCFTILGPDVVKLDMSLIRDIDGSPRKCSVVRSMIGLAARELGMAVICEGVETAAERDTLAALGADLLQGYLFAKPHPEFVRPSMQG